MGRLPGGGVRGTVHLVLVGLMGTGKTTVGRELASRLGRPFRDSDRDLERATGLTADRLARREGAEALHRWEVRILLEALGEPVPSVIAAAASVVDDHRAREALAPHRVVWLRAPVEALVERMGGEGHRPAFGREPEELLADQLRRREPRYRGTADLVVEVGEREVASVVEEIIAGLEG